MLYPITKLNDFSLDVSKVIFKIKKNALRTSILKLENITDAKRLQNFLLWLIEVAFEEDIYISQERIVSIARLTSNITNENYESIKKQIEECNKCFEKFL